MEMIFINVVWYSVCKLILELFENNAHLMTSVALDYEISNFVPTGMPCLTYYNTDKQWYRGEILSVQESTNILCTVRFVDYGTVENVPLNK